MQKEAAYWIRALALAPHPEGGYFRETWRSHRRTDPGESGRSRDLGSAIYFLLEGDDFSAFHRLAADEIWHFYLGDPLTITMISPVGVLSLARLGRDPERGEAPQVVVPAGVWFAASRDAATGIASRDTTEIASGSVSRTAWGAGAAGFALIGCTTAPGFEFADWELADRSTLLSRFPEHREVITRLSRA